MLLLHPDESRVREEFARFVSIDTESLSERAMADTLLKTLHALGCAVEEDGAAARLGGTAGNLIAYLPGTLPGPPLLLCCHMDTVAPGRGKRAVFHADGRITSHGETVLGGDDAAGICAVLEGIRITREAGLPHRELTLVFTAAEELYCAGSAFLAPGVLRAEAGFVPDVSGPVGAAVTRAPSIVSFSLKVRGRAAHAGFEPERGIHAIALMSKILAALPLGRLDAGTTRNVGSIEGGSVKNAVPDQCSVQGEIRSFSHDRAMAALREIETLARDRLAGSGAAFELRHQVHFRSFTLPESAAPLRYFDAACRGLGIAPQHVETFGGSDANVLNALGIPTVPISCGMYNCHSTAEYALLPDILNCAALISLLIRTESDAGGMAGIAPEAIKKEAAE